MSRLGMARNRTDAKLRYAGVHLSELQGVSRRGDDFDRAHQESFLFHLLGVQDGLLHEINITHLSDQLEKVTYRAISEAVNDSESPCPAFAALRELREDDNGWLSRAIVMRNWSTHRRDVCRAYYKGGENDGAVHLHDMKAGKEIKMDYVNLFEQWLASMKELVQSVRAKMPGAKDD